MNLIVPHPTRKIIPHYKGWTLSAVERLRLVGQTSATEITVNDAIKTQQASETTVREADLIIEVNPPVDPESVMIENLTPDIISLDGARAIRVGDGTARVRVTIENTPRIANFPVELIISGGTLVFNRWLAGTFAAYQEDSIRAALVGRTAANMPMFTVRGGSPTRNPNNLLSLAGRDVSCISETVPTTIHIASDTGLQVEHYTTGTVRYQAMNGNVYTRTVSNYYPVPDADLRVVKYDPVPADVVPAVLPPANIEQYCTTVDPGVLCWSSDQEKKIHLRRLAVIHTNLNAYVHPGIDLSEFYEAVVGGDSGSNAGFLHPDGVRLIGMNGWTYGGGGGGSAYDDFLTQIQTGMTAIGCSGSIEIFDPSAHGFPSY